MAIRAIQQAETKYSEPNVSFRQGLMFTLPKPGLQVHLILSAPVESTQDQATRYGVI
jgi:hypothetical protein